MATIQERPPLSWGAKALLYLVLAVPSASLAGDASIRYFDCGAQDISADGTVAVGSFVGLGGNEACRWTAEDGMTSLGLLPGYAFSIAQRVSGDGTFIAGTAWNYPANTARPFTWTAATGMVAMPTALGNSGVHDVSTNGTVVIGTGEDGFSTGSYRWRRTGGILVLPPPPGLDYFPDIFANSVSGDGSIVVGTTRHANNRAFRWTAATGTILLPTLIPEGGLTSSGSSASFISPDGRLVYGNQRLGPQQITSCRWEEDGTITLLPLRMDIDGGNTDGSMVIGNYGPALIYDDANGIRSIQDVLVNELGIDLGGRIITSATGCSADARLICGGSAIGNQGEAYLARLPLPGDTYGDISADSEVDADDAKPFGTCMKGSGIATRGTCRTADLDGDGDVDLRDYTGLLQRLVTDPCPIIDVTGDCAVDDLDLEIFLGCVSGPPALPAPPPSECRRSDLNSDGAVDLRDFAMLQRLFPVEDDGG